MENNNEKLKELEKKLAKRVSYVGVDLATGKNICHEEEPKTKCNCENEKCVCDNEDCGGCNCNAVTMSYEEFRDLVLTLLNPDILKLNENVPCGINPKFFMETMENVKKLEEYIKKKNDLLRRVSNKYTEIYDKFMQNNLTQKDFKWGEEPKMPTSSISSTTKKPTDEELISRMKNNIAKAYYIMKHVGDKKPAEHTPAGHAERINTVRFNLRKDYKPFKEEYMVDEDSKTPETGVEHFDDIVSKMRKIYIAKNTDYGSSFDKGMNRYGWKSFLTRVYDKFNRVEELTSTGNNPKVVDEKLEDTLMDLANYAILGIIYLRMNNNPNL